jgi:acyl-CoA reductase-like NAD-dependent aldehyde dehydrogenase
MASRRDPTTRADAPAAAARSARSRTVAARAQGSSGAEARVEVRKTDKLSIGGAFRRSESGRSYAVVAPDGELLANARRASRDDLRDAVRAARSAFPGWSVRAPVLRGRILHRVAELMERRRDRLVAEVGAAEGLTPAGAAVVVDRAIDRWARYAGWADTIAQVPSSSNPVAAPFVDVTIPEPMGVVGVVAPETSSLLGLVSRVAPVLVTGNTAVVIASERRPLPAVTLAEVLATSDVPPGVLNLLTGFRNELVPVVAAHGDVDALDLWGCPDDLRTPAEGAAAETMKRLAKRPLRQPEATFDWLDDRAAERPEWIAAFLWAKTVRHPIGV